MNTKYKGPLLIALTAIMWSSAGVMIKLVPWDAMSIVGLRSAFAAVVMLIYMRRPRITFTKPVLLGGVALSATMTFFILANKLTTAANAIVLQYTQPIFVILMSAMVLRTRPKGLDIGAVCVVFAGITLFFFDQLKPDAMLGNLMAIIAGFSFAVVFIVNKMPGAQPEQSILLAYLINIVMGIPFIIMNVTWEAVPWLAVAGMGILQLGIPYLLFGIAIRITSPVTASLIAALEPLLNPIWVMLATGEKPGAFAVAGGAVVLVTIVVYNIISMRRSRTEAALFEVKPTAPTV